MCSRQETFKVYSARMRYKCERRRKQEKSIRKAALFWLLYAICAHSQNPLTSKYFFSQMQQKNILRRHRQKTQGTQSRGTKSDREIAEFWTVITKMYFARDNISARFFVAFNARCYQLNDLCNDSSEHVWHLCRSKRITMRLNHGLCLHCGESRRQFRSSTTLVIRAKLEQSLRLCPFKD